MMVKTYTIYGMFLLFKEEKYNGRKRKKVTPEEEKK
jgi:hypothetical protein